MFQVKRTKMVRIPLVQDDLSTASHIWFDPDVTPFIISEFKDKKDQCVIHACGSTFIANTSAENIIDNILDIKESDERNPT